MKFLTLAMLFVGALAIPTDRYGGDNDGGDCERCGSNGGDNGGNHGGNHGGGGGGVFSCAAGLYSNAQCCATDVLGVADLDCKAPWRQPSDLLDFKNVCARGGQRARCCVLPILGQGVLCKDP